MAKVHPSHKTCISIDASSYDEICAYCFATDGVFGGKALEQPCTATKEDIDKANYREEDRSKNNG